MTNNVPNIKILGLHNWATFIRDSIRNEQDKILISMYMISPHWGIVRRTRINILQELVEASTRIRIKRVILGRPETKVKGRNLNLTAAVTLEKAGWDVRIINKGITLHEKVWVIGNGTVIIGSHNISRSSAQVNLDTSVAIKSEEITKMMEVQFYERWRLTSPIEKNGDKHAKSIVPGNTTRTKRNGREDTIHKANRRKSII